MNVPITINMSRCTGSTFIFFEEISLNMAPIEGLNYKHDWNRRFTRNVPTPGGGTPLFGQTGDVPLNRA